MQKNINSIYARQNLREILPCNFYSADEKRKNRMLLITAENKNATSTGNSADAAFEI